VKPWEVRLSEIFEAAYWKRAGSNIDVWELLESLCDALEVNPRSVGEQHPDFDGSCWVYESPPVVRLPRMYVLYRIMDEEGVVWLYNFELR
jgi:hypothetical protein